MNQAAQMGYEQMGVNDTRQDMDERLRRMQIEAQNRGTDGDAHRSAMGRERETASAIGSVGVGLLAKSDERTKQGVVPLYEEAGTERHWDRDVSKAQPDVTSGASLSGPTPKYSSAPAEKPKASFAAAHAQRKMTPDELKRLGEQMLGTQQAQHKASLDEGPSVKPDPMGEALAHMQPYEYEYKPQHAGDEGQQPGEKNVGPMAQDMAKNPITGSAVIRRPDGMLAVDMTKAGKLSLGAIGYLAAKQRELEAQMARMKGRG